MTGASPSNNENRQSPLPPLSKGGLGGFGSYFLSNYREENVPDFLWLMEIPELLERSIVVW